MVKTLRMMRYFPALLATTIICLSIYSCSKNESYCPPQWAFSIDKKGIPELADPADSVRVRFDEYLNDSTNSSEPVLYYFEVPTIYDNPAGDQGCYISKNREFYYHLKNPDEPPYQVNMEMKIINECTQNYQPQYFTITYDTIP